MNSVRLIKDIYRQKKLLSICKFRSEVLPSYREEHLIQAQLRWKVLLERESVFVALHIHKGVERGPNLIIRPWELPGWRKASSFMSLQISKVL
jgi:hypothetical protein